MAKIERVFRALGDRPHHDTSLHPRSLDAVDLARLRVSDGEHIRLEQHRRRPATQRTVPRFALRALLVPRLGSSPIWDRSRVHMYSTRACPVAFQNILDRHSPRPLVSTTLKNELNCKSLTVGWRCRRRGLGALALRTQHALRRHTLCTVQLVF